MPEMKLKLEIEFEYDEIAMHFGENDPDAKEWFYQDILTEKLDVLSGEIGDYIGSMKIVRHLTPHAQERLSPVGNDAQNHTNITGNDGQE